MKVRLTSDDLLHMRQWITQARIALAGLGRQGSVTESEAAVLTDEIAALSDDEITEVIRRYYRGGAAQFLADRAVA